jgi:hypothetical protein
MPRCKECGIKFDKRYAFQKFCMGNDECIKAHVDYAKRQHAKNWKKTTKLPLKKTKSQKNYLQDEVNKLSKMIDKKYGYLTCIDCDKEMKLIHAAHFHNVQGNENLRYNLHNLHSARAHCNQYSSEHKVGYREGLEKRYGKAYRDVVEYDIRKQYPTIQLSTKEVQEALKTVRAIIRNFDTYNFKDSIHAREMLNNLINIYT